MSFSFRSSNDKMPIKTTINLAMKDSRNINMRVFVPLLIVMVVLLVLFCKFAVVDLLTKASKAETLASEQKALVVQAQQSNSEYDSVLAQYNKYCLVVTGSEEVLLNRLSLLDVLNSIFFTRAQASSVTVTGNTTVMKFTGVSFDIVSQIIKEFKSNEMVEDVGMSTAGLDDDTPEDSTGTLTIKFKAKEVK